ncbi:MAG: hypothetical protein KKE44_10770 [Proteobacteria bacterium]|nr:hypothetical protein [Pseudomonadota bacterium]MBU1583205.1 hypothetical protein [Pseudomonadota bacterium]MBU2455052.1 hypothetical protein [Pseudomonadota bacterium]MBU2627654.1 hypothetical protein [Pseudomonadota bacterium]
MRLLTKEKERKLLSSCWNQLRINDQGMADLTSQSIPYNPEHVYSIRYLGQGKPLVLRLLDAAGSWQDNSGEITVKLLDVN